MAEPNFRLCDICGEHVSKENRLSVTHNRSMDGGGSMEYDVDGYDLCAKHLRESLSYMLRLESNVTAPDMAAGERLKAYLDSRRKQW